MRSILVPIALTGTFQYRSVIISPLNGVYEKYKRKQYAVAMPLKEAKVGKKIA